MADTQIRSARDVPATWTADGMRKHLRTGNMNDDFYKQVFGWNDDELQQAAKRANEALEKAGIRPTEPLRPIRFQRNTEEWTSGALLRLIAEEDLVTEPYNSDRLFSLPHERNDWLRPLWFREDMMLADREPNIVYGFPTLVQKFFQYSRDHTKEKLKHEADALWKATAAGAPSSKTPQTPEHTKRRDISPLRRPGKTARTSLDGKGSSPDNASEVHPGAAFEQPKPHLDNADVHVGWLS